jgi:hypothetical protein
LIGSPVITLEGDKAKGKFYLLIPASYPPAEGEEGEQACWDQGLYDMEFVKESGKWRICGFRFLWNFHTPFDEGWVKTPMAKS